MNKTIILSGLGVIAASGIVALALVGDKIVPSVAVTDQAIRDGQVVVNSVSAVAPSWLVIQTETNGAPGPVIGYTKLKKGENKDVAVKVDVQKATPKLFAMIHVDDGKKDMLDFPGSDMPLMYEGQMVSQLFNTQLK